MLEALRRYAEVAAVQRSAERLGLDLATVEGVLAARAPGVGPMQFWPLLGYRLVGASSEIVGQVLALHELSEPSAQGSALAGR